MTTQGFNGIHFVMVAALFFIGGWLLFRRIDNKKRGGR